MALIKCPECGKEVSENAIACPNCGNPISNQHLHNRNKSSRKSLVKIFLGGGLCIAVLVFITYLAVVVVPSQQ